MKKKLLHFYLLTIIITGVFASCKKAIEPDSKEPGVLQSSELAGGGPVVEGPRQVYMSSGEYSNFILKNDWTLWAFGNNQYGQLGDGTTINRLRPVKVMDNVIAVAAGKYHTLIIKMDGTVWATGRNNAGQLGTGDLTDQHGFVFVRTRGLQIAAGDEHSLLVIQDHQTVTMLYASGSNSRGQLGAYPDSSLLASFKPVMARITSIAAGSNFSLAIKSDRTVWAAGANNLGQLGDGSSVDKRSLVQVTDDGVEVAAGLAHSLVRKWDYSVWATGYNGFGQHGDGTSNRKSQLTRVAEGMYHIAAGYNHSLFTEADGRRRLFAMGSNTHGQLGDGTTENRFSPVLIDEFVGNIAAGGYNSFYVKDDRSVRGTGYNAYGQLGIGNTQNQLSYVNPLFP